MFYGFKRKILSVGLTLTIMTKLFIFHGVETQCVKNGSIYPKTELN